ncbi:MULTISPECIES: cupin-like domain-containing protein [Sphingomonas]|uniref:cupin-like domain-containing protein n=1 Tax=Sphingomonas TaxID=13687 RepID=UPI000DEEB616|nr:MULTISPECIES: cupin-like domain-containing protein [Sphingomonas]
MAEAEALALEALPAVDEEAIGDAAALDARLRGADTPFVVRGLAADWPLVRAGQRSGGAAREYLLQHRRERAFTFSLGAAGAGERLFYDDAMAMNFRTLKGSLPEVFGAIDATEGQADGPAIYLASIDMQSYFDGLDEANRIDLGERRPLASIWIGTPTRIAAHNDVPDNLAVCAVGHRRFTLFPPEQFANLYLGPIDHTPAGRTVSMVDLKRPDFAAFPRFREALATAQVAELGPGDALFIPSLWWHHVEALDPFNVLVNYWWRETRPYLGMPQDALHHAMLAIRDLPPAAKAHWRALFDHYVFDNDEGLTAHIPAGARGVLDPLTPETAGSLRANILRSLSR